MIGSSIRGGRRLAVFGVAATLTAGVAAIPAGAVAAPATGVVKNLTIAKLVQIRIFNLAE